MEKKENNSAEKEGFLSFSLFLFPLARNNENGNIENRILIAIHYVTGVILCGCKEKIAVDQAVLYSKHCVRGELTRIKNSFVEKLHS